MNERRRYLEAVQAASFALLDTRLYLDTHPNDQEALAAMRIYEEQAAAARENYESRFGSLTGCSCGDRWSWVDDPWPWNYCAN